MTKNSNFAFNRAGWHQKFLPYLLLTAFFSQTSCSGPQSILEPAGPAAAMIASLWWGMLVFFSLAALLVIGLWLYAMKKKSAVVNKNQDEKKEIAVWIIGGGILLPVVSIVVLLGFGIPIGHKLLPLPVKQEPLQINITGHQWWWEVNYPDIGVTLINELHLPVSVPVNIHAMSADVIHSFWIPRLGGKIDMIPGYQNILRLQAEKVGDFRGQCAEFCGLQHARMVLRVQVHTAADFAAWLSRQTPTKQN